MLALKTLLRETEDPYSVITLAGDTAAFQLTGEEEIVPHLKSEDPMVRWNAAGVLFTRLRDVHFAGFCLELLARETNNMVIGIALNGQGAVAADRGPGASGSSRAKTLGGFRGEESGLPRRHNVSGKKCGTTPILGSRPRWGSRL